MVIIDHLFADTIAKCLGCTTLDLALGHDRVNNTTSVNRRDGFEDTYHAGLGIYFNLCPLRGKGRWRIVAHPGGGSHDLLLVLDVQRVQGDLRNSHCLSIGSSDDTVANGHIIRMRL